MSEVPGAIVMRYASYHVGLLRWSAFRDALREMKFRGHDVSWLESSGCLSKTFTVKAPLEVHVVIEAWIEANTKERHHEETG